MARITPEAWLEAGMERLTEQGPEGLVIEALCVRVGATKGSFYHHFASQAEYRARLLEHFEREGTLRIIEAAEEAPTPRAKLARLLDIVVSLSRDPAPDPETAIRAWARQDEAVAEVQARVDARRTEYVQGLLEAIVTDPGRARTMARSLYATLVGSQHMQPPLRGDELRAVFDAHLRLYGLEPHGGRS